MSKKEVTTNKLVDELKEGYVIYDSESEGYFDESVYAVDDFSDAYIYSNFDDAKEAFSDLDDQDFCYIFQIRQTLETLKKFERKITFEEVK